MIHFTRRWPAALAALSTACAAVLIGAAAGRASGQGPTPQAGPAPAVAPVCWSGQATNPYLQTRVVTTSDPSYYTSTAWSTLACGTTWVSVPRGRHGLVTVNVDAEVTCTGAAGQWCLGRALIGGVEGQPAAPEPDSFAWAHSAADPTLWESNAFTRTRPLACPSTAIVAACVYPVAVQVRNHASGLTFRVDDSTVRVQVTYF
jgi:hypothetical protein